MKKMRKEILVSVFVIMLLAGIASIASAYDTMITITTLPNIEVQIKATDPLREEQNLLVSVNGNTTGEGVYSTTITTSKSPVDFIILLTKDGQATRVDGKSIFRYSNRVAGLPLNVEILPGRITSENGSVAADTTTAAEEASELSANETAEENTSEAAETATLEAASNETEQASDVPEAQDSDSGITGNIIGDKVKSILSSSLTYIIVGAIAGLFVIIFAVKMFLLKKPSQDTIKIKKYSDLKKDIEEQQKIAQAQQSKQAGMTANDKDIIAAEKRIKAAEDELRKIKENRQQLRAAEQRFAQARQDLDRIKNSQAEI